MNQKEDLNSASPSRLHALAQYYEKNEQKIAIWFFVGGFIFDLVTLDRIDSWVTIGQQIVYLLIIWAALIQMFFEEAKPEAGRGIFALVRGGLRAVSGAIGRYDPRAYQMRTAVATTVSTCVRISPAV